mgnify:FL=1
MAVRIQAINCKTMNQFGKGIGHRVEELLESLHPERYQEIEIKPPGVSAKTLRRFTSNAERFLFNVGYALVNT